MIKLHLGIYEGDVQEHEFNTKKALLDFVNELKMFDCIWLCASDGEERSEIIVTEYLETLHSMISKDFMFREPNKNIIHIHEYQTFEDAYKVALDMKEGHPKCYN